MHRPSVLFLDEPTVGADVAARRAILDVVRDLAAQGTAVVYTTHYLTELVDLAADVAVLHEGRILLEAPVGRVLSDHALPTVALVTQGAPLRAPGWSLESSGAGQDRWVPDADLLSAIDPTSLVATALGALDADTQLRAIEITPPSLESAFLALTGQALLPVGSPSSADSITTPEEISDAVHA